MDEEYLTSETPKLYGTSKYNLNHSHSCAVNYILIYWPSVLVDRECVSSQTMFLAPPVNTDCNLRDGGVWYATKMRPLNAREWVWKSMESNSKDIDVSAMIMSVYFSAVIMSVLITCWLLFYS